MAIAFVEFGSINGANTSGGTDGPITVFTATPTGSFAVCGLRVNATGRTVSITDDHSNTWNLVTSKIYNSSGDEFFFFYAENITTGSNILNITLHVSGADVFVRAACASYSGVATANSRDQNNSNSGSGTVADGGAVTTTCANEVVVLATSNATSGTVTAGGGFTDRGLTETDVAICDRIVSATGTYTGTETYTASGGWAGIAVSFADVTAPCAQAARFRGLMTMGVGI